jgi:hypothetical protein
MPVRVGRLVGRLRKSGRPPPPEQLGEQLTQAYISGDENDQKDACDGRAGEHRQHRDLEPRIGLPGSAVEDARTTHQEKAAPGDSKHQDVVGQHRMPFDEIRNDSHAHVLST